VADVVLFLAWPTARYVVGETIAVDGGLAKLATSPVALPDLAGRTKGPATGR
jgi:hypothetical protein